MQHNAVVSIPGDHQLTDLYHCGVTQSPNRTKKEKEILLVYPITRKRKQQNETTKHENILVPLSAGKRADKYSTLIALGFPSHWLRKRRQSQGVE